MTEHVYLKTATKLEPLSARWYTWSHLVSPVQHALNMAFRHVPSFNSFVSNAAIHEAASRNPKMLGGSFMELTSGDVAGVSQLMSETRERYTHMLRFAEDLVELDRSLQGENGFSLDHVYEKLTPALAGMVEVSYDTNNHPGLRVIEELAYRGGLDNLATQEISFALMRDADRNFFLNTPRLPNDSRMIFPVAFTDSRMDLLGRARMHPTSFDELVDAFGVAHDDRARFRDYFTTDEPLRNDPAYLGDGVRVRYFGHACVLIQSSEVSVLIDPFLTWDDDGDDQHLCFNDLPDHIDYVFLTHNHQDHFSPELLLQLRQRIGCVLVPRNNPNNVADPSMRLALQSLGFRNVRVMDWMETVELPDGAITSIPFYGEHADLNIVSKHGMHLRLKGRTFLFLADSDCKDRTLYKRVVASLGGVDTLFIGMECDGAPLSWMYGAYLSRPVSRKDDASRRLSGSDAAKAWAIAEEFGCRTAYVYAMGQEPWMRFVTGLEYTPQSKQLVESDTFLAMCRERGLTAERLHGCRTLTA